MNTREHFICIGIILLTLSCLLFLSSVIGSKQRDITLELLKKNDKDLEELRILLESNRKKLEDLEWELKQ